jgi:catechol 2,3-dioxygenase-like lactoylglutathione lyase family enzyme
MIDHIGFSVSDFERAKEFYVRALAPLDYSVVMEVTEEQSGYSPAAGFGADGKPDFWIGGEGALNKPVHIAIVAKDRSAVDAFYQAAIAAGGRDNGHPGFARTITRTTTAPLFSIPTATTSKPSATRPSEVAYLNAGSTKIAIFANSPPA